MVGITFAEHADDDDVTVAGQQTLALSYIRQGRRHAHIIIVATMSTH